MDSELRTYLTNRGLLDQFYCRKTIGPLLNGRAKFSPAKKEPAPCQ